MNDSTIKKIVNWAFVALGIVAVACVVSLFTGDDHALGVVQSPPTVLDYVQFQQGIQVPAGPSVSTSATGTIITKGLTGFTNCTGSATIGTTTSAQYDCSIPVVTSGDVVFIGASSTNPITVSVVKSYASTTASGSARLVFFNASSSPSDTIATTSLPYWVVRGNY